MQSVWFVGVDFNISHGGENDIKKHIKTTKHQQACTSACSSKKMDNYFVKKSDSCATTKSECLFTSFIIEHNLPISIADHALNFFLKCFPTLKSQKI